MKSIMKKWGIAAILLYFLVVWGGCSSDSDSGSDSPSASYATISFVDESGNSLSSQQVNNTYSVEYVYFEYKKEGYKCSFFDSEGNEVKSGSFQTTKDCTITVKATPISYTIHFEKSTYDYRTVSGTLPADISCLYDSEYTLPENSLSCSSYGSTYKTRGWSKSSSDCSKRGEYTSGQSVKNLTATDGETVTLYPCFTNDDSFALKFYKSTGIYASYDTVYADEGEIIPASSIPTASKSGYDFKGYYLSGDSAQTAIDFTTYKVTGDATFYPIFAAATYTATFVTAHGSAPADVSWTYSESYSEKTDISTGSYVLTATGYTFSGWYKDGSSYETYNIYHNTSSDMTLTAKWTPWTATICFDSNSPDKNYGGSMNYMTADYDTAKNLLPNAFYVSGYKFTGWNTEKNGSGTAYSDEASYTWKGSANKETVTLYAQWEKLQTSVSVKILAPATGADLSLTYDSSAKNFKAALSGASAFTWYIDGKEVAGENGATLSVYTLTEGQHSVMAKAEFGGKTYGQTIVVSVSTSE